MQEPPVIEQDRESDTTKYNQKSQNNLQAIQMPDQRIIEITRQRGKSGITEGRNAMNQGKKKFIVNSPPIFYLPIAKLTPIPSMINVVRMMYTTVRKISLKEASFNRFFIMN